MLSVLSFWRDDEVAGRTQMTSIVEETFCDYHVEKDSSRAEKSY